MVYGFVEIPDSSVSSIKAFMLLPGSSVTYLVPYISYPYLTVQNHETPINLVKYRLSLLYTKPP